MADASQRPRMESLLSSFPAPPSFIPPSPSPMMLAYDRSSRASSELEFANPPPTRPPTMPLPPVPAGGGVSELGLDALMLLCNTPSRRTSVASKRMSRMSDTNVVLPGARPSHMAPMTPPSSVSLPDDHPPLDRRRSALPPPAPSPPLPPPCETPVPRRPASPDIQHILATTPRPLVRRMLPHNLGARRASTGASSSPSLIHSTASSQSSSDNDDDVLAAGEQSDSSIDTRTPLPHLMVKAGVLSPYSKILITPAEASSQGAASGSSKNSLLLKDGRDTQRRKNRHRDGRLLREGVGLTTGLGWSDSEDEDAPSPLTHRLSTLDLSRRPSMLSVRSAYSRSRTPSRSPRTSTFSNVPSTSNLSLSRTSSTASSIKPSTSTSIASPSSSRRQRTGGGSSDPASLRSSASTSALSALAHQSSPPPVPDLPSSPGMPTMRRTVSHYPLRPPDESLFKEKPLPQPPMLEHPPPRSTSQVRTRLSGPASAPPSAFYSTGGLPRPRTYSTGSNVSSTSSVGSTGTAAAKPRVKSVPVGSGARVTRTVSTASTTSNVSTSTAASGISRRPAMKRQASMPLPPPSMPQRASLPTSATSTIPMPTPGPSSSAFSMPNTPVSPGGGPRPLKLVAAAGAGTALPVPRGRTGTVGRTGTGMAYRTSAAPRPRLSAPSAV